MDASQQAGLYAAIGLVATFSVAVLALVTARKDAKKIKKNKKNIKELKDRLGNVEKRRANNVHLFEILHEINLSLDKKLKVILAELQLKKIATDPQLSSEYQNLENRLDKLFSEIALFSKNKGKRLSAQRSLANYNGDIYSLELMELINDKKLGVYDAELSKAISELKQNFGLDITASSGWTGR